MLAYLLWNPYDWWGVGFTFIVALLWYVEIRRGNQTEDYIIENYENPLR